MERELVAKLIQVIDKNNTRSLYEFARRHADRLGVPLPASWTLTAEKEEAERAADEAGWPR